jgi:excisionase family DNA binding protein
LTEFRARPIIDGLPVFAPGKGQDFAMRLVELVEKKTEALRVNDVAPILGVSIQQVYKMAANGQIPSFRVGCSVRFDPQDFAMWLKTRSLPTTAVPISSARTA